MVILILCIVGFVFCVHILLKLEGVITKASQDGIIVRFLYYLVAGFVTNIFLGMLIWFAALCVLGMMHAVPSEVALSYPDSQNVAAWVSSLCITIWVWTQHKNIKSALHLARNKHCSAKNG